MKRKIFSMVLALCLFMCIAPQTVLALTDTETNNAFAQAQVVTMGDTITGEITTDDVDVYSFTLAESGRVKLDVTACMEWHSLVLFDKNGTQLFDSERNEWNSLVGSVTKIHELDLDKGTYYFLINGDERYNEKYYAHATGTYTIQISFTSAAATETEDNDSVAQANALALGSSVNGQIALNDADDFYSVVLDESGRLTLEVTAYMQYHAVEIFNSTGAQLDVSDGHEWNETVGRLTTTHTLDLEAGVYYIKINGKKNYEYSYPDPSTGNYTIEASFVSANATETENNNTLAKANDLNLNGSVNGQIAINDGEDFYKVVLTESGKLTLDMTAYMKYHTVELFNAEGTHLWASDDNEWNSTVGYLNKIHNLDLEKGTYYIKINGKQYYDYGSNKSTGNYTLKTSFVGAKATETEENDELNNANALQLGSSVSGQIAINDKDDFYKVELPQTGVLTLDMTAYMNWHAIELFNAEGTHLWVSDRNEWNSTVGYLSEIHNLHLEKGTYYIKVNGEEVYENYSWGKEATGNYTLKTGFTASSITETEENDVLADANDLTLDGVVRGQISLNDHFDFYKIVMPTEGELKINISAWMKYHSLYLLSENGTELWKSQYNEWDESAGIGFKEHTITLEAGTYYIKVSGYRYNTNDGSTGTYMLLLNHDHTWDQGVVTKAPSGNKAGEKTYTCTKCSATYTKSFWQAEVSRIYGATRYETSFAIADAMKAELGVSKFNAIVVASGTEFADALSGSYLATVKNAPILILKSGNVNQVKEYIKANLNRYGTVYILGGEKAVPKSMETGLEGFTVKRLGGATRYATNLAILKEAGARGDILIATGTNFADSLSASAAGKPILLVSNKLNEEQLEFIKGLNGKKIILGGTSAVSARVENQLKELGTVERIGGATRYETSVLIAERFFSNPDAVVLAYAQNFPDGLCGGPLADSINAPLILTASGKESVAAAYVKLQPVSQAYVLGGPTLINDKAVRNILELSATEVIPVWGK